MVLKDELADAFLRLVMCQARALAAAVHASLQLLHVSYGY